MSGDIFLTIDRIVLHGLDRIDRHALSEALQQALLDQLGQQSSLTSADLSRVRITISLPDNMGGEQLGQVLGQTLGGIIGNSGTEKPAQGRHGHG